MRWRLARRSPSRNAFKWPFSGTGGRASSRAGFSDSLYVEPLDSPPIPFPIIVLFRVPSSRSARKCGQARALQNVSQDGPTYCGLKAQPIVAYGNAIGMSGKRNSRAESPIHNSSGLQPSKNFRPRFLGRCPRLLWFAPLALDGFNGEIRACVFAVTRFLPVLMILPRLCIVISFICVVTRLQHIVTSFLCIVISFL